MKKKVIALIALGAVLLAVVLIIVIGKKEVTETPLTEQTENTETVKGIVKKPAVDTPSTVEEAKEALGVSISSEDYISTNPGFSVEYPTNFTVNISHVYKGMGPGNDISGIAFMIPAETIKGTNLLADSYISFERRAKLDCVASDFLSGVSITDETIVTLNGVRYRVASKAETVVGNTYNETVYVDDNCNAIRYYIHSTTIDSNTAGTVQQFDMDSVVMIFDEIRDSYILKK